MAVYKANAIVLRRIPLGETDKIITLYTRELGKFNAVAKGARRTTSRLAGSTEPLMLLRALLAEGMNLDVLTQCEIRESFPTLRGDFDLFLRATYACELLDKLTVERDPDPQTFDLLLSVMYILQRAADPDLALHAFELQLLAQIGYAPRLDSCARCDRDFAGSLLPVAYSPVRGGALCAACADSTQEEPLTFSPETATMMSRLIQEENARTIATLTLAEPVRSQMNRILRAHLRHRLEREVKSTAFLDAMRAGAMDNLNYDAVTGEHILPISP